MQRRQLPLYMLVVGCVIQSSVWGQENDSPPTEEPRPPAGDVQVTARDALKAVADGDFTAAGTTLFNLLGEYAIPALTALSILFVVYFAATFAARIASMPVRARVDETLGRFVGKLIFYMIMIGALLGVLQFFGVGVTSFAAVIASAGFAVGLAFQGTLANFAAGIMLLVFRPFKVGDVINAAGITAKVNEIDLFHTIFDTPDNRRIIVPNGMISNGIIENVSHHRERRVEVTVGVDYSADIDRTREVLQAAADTVDGVIEGDGRGAQVCLTELADSSVNWTLRAWFETSDYWAKREELIRAVKVNLDTAGIGIPYPQMDVHVSKVEP